MDNVAHKLVKQPRRNAATKDKEVLRLQRELEVLRNKYIDKCEQVDTLEARCYQQQDESALLRKVQELLVVKEKYQHHLQEYMLQIQDLKQQIQEKNMLLETKQLQFERSVAEQQTLIAQLESQLQECRQQNSLYLQTAWQEALEIMETDYAAAQSRIHELEHRVAELQEQVLAQAKLKGEYETAMQYLQEQSLHFQGYALQLSTALERLFEEHREWKKVEVPIRVDLPAFLVRARA